MDVFCSADGAWSAEPPVCQLIDCGTPPDIPHGVVFSDSNTFSSLAVYSCILGEDCIKISRLVFFFFFLFCELICRGPYFIATLLILINMQKLFYV